MAWPFSTVTAPNKDSGFVAVPVALANPPNFDLVSQFWLLGVHFANDTDSDIEILLTDGSGSIIVPRVRVPAHGIWPPDAISWEFLPTVGLQWRADGVPQGGQLTGKVWGYS